LARRRELHEGCARFIAREFADIAEIEPELVALHYAQAGLPAEAAAYHGKAGDRAAGQYAYVEAINSYRAALAQVALMPAERSRDEREMALQLKLGAAYVIIHGPQHPLTREAYVRAKAIGQPLDNIDDLFKATWGIWYHANISRDLTLAASEAEELVALSRRSGDDRHALEALHCRWSSALFRGDYDAAFADSSHAQRMYDADRHHALSFTFGGHDPGVCAYCVAATTSSMLGYPERGARLTAECLSLAEQLAHPPSLAHAFMNAANTSLVARDYSATHDFAATLLEIAERFNLPPQKSVANYLLGWSEAHMGDVQRGLSRMDGEFERVTMIGPMPILHTALFSETLLRAGRGADALILLDRTLASLRFPDLGLYLSELYRVRGDCLLQQHRLDDAAEAFVRASALAEKQCAKLLKLRASVGLVKAQTTPDGKTAARAALKTFAGEFSEGHDRPDLTEARTLF
jgi:tetratricopeptide (TPR) repeat protein